VSGDDASALDDPVDRRLVAAIHADDVHRVASELVRRRDTSASGRSRAARAIAACERIGMHVDAERARVIGLLTSARVVIGPPASGGPTQRHEFTLDVRPDDLGTAIAALEGDGYRRRHRLTDGAMRSLVRTGSDLALSRSADATMVVRLRWRSARRESTLTRAVRPTIADWDLITLPDWAWWGYSGVRPVRLALERAGLRSRDHGELEPFLVTPIDLVDRLLDVAGVDSYDTVLDVGCGDGRIVVRAAQRHGCRAIGIERSSELASAARQRVGRAGLTDVVEIIEGDALAADVTRRLGDVTVAVLFLPMRVARDVVPALFDALAPGARIVLHEQSPLDTAIPRPVASTPVVGDESITVAHRWDVPDSR
jgi:SAM-dependent methyltransferase